MHNTSYSDRQVWSAKTDGGIDGGKDDTKVAEDDSRLFFFSFPAMFLQSGLK